MAEQPTQVIVFGATGNIGRRLLASGLRQGHQVTAFVRSGQKLLQQWHGMLPDGLRIVEGDALDPSAVGEAIEGHDAVVNAAGHASEPQLLERICSLIVGQAERVMPEPRRVWLFGGAAALDIPQTPYLGADLPGVPAIYQVHKRNWQMLKRSATEWSLMCPGPMVPASDDMPQAGLRISTEVLPYPLGAWTRFAPRIALSLSMKVHLPEITVTYEDVADIVMAHLAPGGPFARKRVGVALPEGQRLQKQDWRPGRQGPEQ
ncbi:NAD(P)-dependent oxidoreductase [Phreatobacter stygius]|uniref:NAD-dependent epimerase/dehydratase family protein n=1 Tax=Phreatobacter stygius TaxID=1940610 RepID=A0A4D7BBF6_9HYPH|nr:NAD(P)H-binding protein [Phreatobacter stygius]QCI67438.1 NAD-dependent epimerase/dehydratase family protein [Phreatobacter stygius]